MVLATFRYLPVKLKHVTPQVVYKKNVETLNPLMGSSEHTHLCRRGKGKDYPFTRSLSTNKITDLFPSFPLSEV